jgi:hypothetical protein
MHGLAVQGLFLLTAVMWGVALLWMYSHKD